MKVRNMQNLPVLLADTAEKVGRVERAVIGDDYSIFYLVVHGPSGKPYLIFHDDFEIAENAVLIHDVKCMKSYAHGEELSVYEKKLGDAVFDRQGRELGVVSDFILKREQKKVWGVEVSSGVLKDMLDGRSEFALNQVNWATQLTAIVSQEGSEQDEF